MFLFLFCFVLFCFCFVLFFLLIFSLRNVYKTLTTPFTVPQENVQNTPWRFVFQDAGDFKELLVVD